MVISLLCTFIAIQTPLHEVFKFPLLVTHYFEHKKHDETMTLLKFMHIHYTQKTVVDDDYDKDMQLPFKDCSAPIFFTMSTISKKVQISLHVPAPESKSLLSVTTDTFLSTDFHD
ncbi:MAG: hypothetical protein KDC07_11040, partial [Chitinophagaceae bacterium]|nr:hypothetical protein [Chitinophagaceae bacterium]